MQHGEGVLLGALSASARRSRTVRSSQREAEPCALHSGLMKKQNRALSTAAARPGRGTFFAANRQSEVHFPNARVVDQVEPARRRLADPAASVEEVARRCGVNRATIYRAIGRGAKRRPICDA
jgi:hypothetical protein